VRDPRDIVDIPGVQLRPAADASGPESPAPAPSGSSPTPKAWLGIWFRCCHTYGRLYKDAAGRRYVGGCPRCGAEASVRVGEGGTNRRLFEAR